MNGTISTMFNRDVIGIESKTKWDFNVWLILMKLFQLTSMMEDLKRRLEL